MVKLMFFGPLKDLMGYGETHITLPASVNSRADLIAFISEGNPHVSEALNAPTVRLIINNEIAVEDGDIGDATELAFLPPLSGG